MSSSRDKLSAEEQSIVETVRSFVDKDVKPVAQHLDHTNTYPEDLIDTMKEMGVFGLAIPEPYGFVAVSTTCYALVTEELARGWMSLAGAMGGHTVVAKLLLTYGTEEQKQKYLPRMATGELRATMALTEPGGGSDLQAMRTVATREDEGYRINGSKTWITNARRSALVALLCKTDPDAKPKHKGVSILLVEKVPGFTVSKDLPKLGYKGVESCELSFVDCRVPADALLGAVEGKGFAQMMKGLEVGRIQVAARATGVARAAFDDALAYAQERESFGQPIWKHQSVETCWRTWGPSSLRPAAWCWPRPSGWTPGSVATWRPAWPSCSRRRSRWRSRWMPSACTAATATPPSTTSSATSATRR